MFAIIPQFFEQPKEIKKRKTHSEYANKRNKPELRAMLQPAERR